MDRLKLNVRIFAYLLGFCALLLLILGLFQTVFLPDMYKYIRKGEMEQAIALVEKNIDSPDLQTILHELELDKEIIVRPAQEFAQLPKPGLDNRDRGGRPPESLTQTKEFSLQDGRTISLIFYAMITPVEATVSTLRLQLYIVSGLMLLLAILLAIIISQKISQPIEEINKGAKKLAAGDYDTHFEGRGFLEIRELSDTLNTAARELSQVENLRRELMANVSHDLRTPLALIYSYAEMMHDFPNEVTSEQTQTIMDETKRLSSLVNDILNVSQLEAGTMELNLATFNITESIAATVERMAQLVKNDGYRLCFEDNATAVYVHADEGKIMQALYNLLLNAVHYSGADKEITVRQSVADGYVKIEVIDHGEGIAPEHLPWIWDRYYKIDKKHKRPVTGTGLGLSIVKKITDLHDGSYGVASEVGRGSVFWFRLRESVNLEGFFY